MKTILKSAALITGIMAAIGTIGYTGAFFQDVETSGDNTFQAGSLDLIINEPAHVVWKAEDWLPGDEVEGEIEFENVGSLPINGLIMEVE